MHIKRNTASRNFLKLLLGLALLFCGVLLAYFTVNVHADALNNLNWLESTNFQVTKTRDLPASQEPDTFGNGCASTTKDSNGTLWCRVATPMGYVTNGTLEGPKGTASLKVADNSTILASPLGSPNVLLSARYVSSGSYWAFSRSAYDPTKLTYQTIFGYPPTNQYSYTITGPTTISLPKGLDPRTVAYSANGKWLAFYSSTDIPSSAQTVVLVNTVDFSSRTISVNSGALFNYAGTRGVNLAVSDDGRFVAINGYVAGSPVKPTLRVYDTSTCIDQSSFVSGFTTNLSNSCEYNDVWRGAFRTTTYVSNVPSASGVEYPRHLRFNTDNSLSFQGVYGRTSSTSFSVAEYVVVPNAQNATPLSLLVMGDSYISGEGAYYYRNGTDTKNNKCHNSWLAYGYQRGWQVYPGDKVKSVACSGAKIDDIDSALWADTAKNSEDDRGLYVGQAKPEVFWRDRVSRKLILDNYIPGYANQMIFNEGNQPRTVVLSVGGNDIGFSDIIKSCVLTTASSGCYNSYSERQQLMYSITNQYPRLKQTYLKALAGSNGGKVYVMGYPQIAKVGGSCRSNVHMNANEIQFSKDLVTYLNKIIKRAASDAGVYYVDTESALTGNRLCEAPKNSAAMNGLTAGNDKYVRVPLSFVVPGSLPFITIVMGLGQESYHPTALGYKMLGATLLGKTQNFTAAMPAKTNLGPITFSTSEPLISGFAPGDADLSTVFWQTPPPEGLTVLQKGQKYRLQNNTLQLDPTAPIRVVRHSTPVILYEGLDQNAEVTLPGDTEPGAHILDVYGTALDGQEVVVKQVVYVAESPTDTDGDGIDDEHDGCVMTAQVGFDEDGDGIDDACDGDVIDQALLPDGVANLPVETGAVSVSDDFTESTQQSASLLIPVLPTPPPPVDDPVDTGGNPTSGSGDDQSTGDNSSGSDTLGDDQPTENPIPPTDTPADSSPIQVDAQNTTAAGLTKTGSEGFKIVVTLHSSTTGAAGSVLAIPDAGNSLGQVLGASVDAQETRGNTRSIHDVDAVVGTKHDRYSPGVLVGLGLATAGTVFVAIVLRHRAKNVQNVVY